MSDIATRYRTRADIFAAKIAAVEPGRWSDPSPCEEWTARDVVGHIIDMHAVMLRPLGRSLSPAPSVAQDPLAAFTAARADVEALLDDPATAERKVDTPTGNMSVEQHIDQVASADMVLHGWDLSRATGQDDTIDPAEVEAMWPHAQYIPDEMRIPGAFGPGVVVLGPEVEVPDDAPLQHRLLGLFGRDPNWSA
ncbi:TIGR03086 family metal-binding protein [Streptosporangium sp. NPDC049376]|uniref:TIGR03086 family metal-binding protein n=1 Tax=Streptosporangium sp. NPDC049376 TaxID=3366192 RepID=UPI00378B84BD